MENKLAIVISGQQNSGKSSTLREIINQYTNKQISIAKSGWQQLKVFPRLPHLIVTSYFSCSSASESDTTLAARLESQNELPNIIFVAIQLGGHLELNSRNFLASNNYTIWERQVDTEISQPPWTRFDEINGQTVLQNRASIVISEVQLWIKSRILI